ncbi:MAG: carboxypeptidase-like regulatory domain-containing protein [Candidatus Acidiferrales bacterium]
MTDRGRPVKGLRLVLGPDESHTLQRIGTIYALTDADGYARFSNLTPGSFLLTSDHDGGVADGTIIEVSPGGPPDVTVTLGWPSHAPLSVRSVRGTLRGPDYYPRQAQTQLSLSLLDGVSARVIATTLTDGKGDFNFANEVPSGLYFLRLNPSDLLARDGEQIQGMMAIEVDRKANQDVLDLDVGWTTCGLAYEQRERYPELKVSTICGDVADVVGAAVSNAQVMLLATGEDGEILEQTRSGARGQFALQEQHEGAYQLLVESLGFLPFLRVIHIEAAAPSQGCQQPIHIRLQVAM